VDYRGVQFPFSQRITHVVSRWSWGATLPFCCLLWQFCWFWASAARHR